jgi:hypothetical protein
MKHILLKVCTSMNGTSTRKAWLSGAILLLSLGALFWQIGDYRQRMAEIEATQERSFSDAPDSWRAANKAERSAPQEAIQKQLEAFRRNDYVAAMTYQSRALRGHFPTPSVFRQMIQNGYPQFARCRKIEFGEAHIDQAGSRFRVAVFVTGADNVKVRAVYEMIKEDGAWRVSGVQGGRTSPPAKQKPAAARKITA